MPVEEIKRNLNDTGIGETGVAGGSTRASVQNGTVSLNTAAQLKSAERTHMDDSNVRN